MDPVIVGTRWDGQLSLSADCPDQAEAGLSAECILHQIAGVLFTEGPLQGRLCLATQVEVVRRGMLLAVGTPVRTACIVRAVRADESGSLTDQTVRVGAAVGAATPSASTEWLLTGVIEVQVCEVVTVNGRSARLSIV